MIILQQFKEKISELLNKPDYEYLAMRHAASLQGEINQKEREIEALHAALREVCKFAFMVQGTAESKDPQHWIEVVKKRYGYDF